MIVVRIAVVGSGSVGRTLAAGFAAAGHDVVMGSRTPDEAELAAWASGSGVTTAVPADAVRDADIVVNATPGTASVSALRAAGVAELAGTVLLDVSNPLDFTSGQPRLSTDRDDSIAEQLQRAFPAMRVVKSLCTVNNPIMVDPGRLPEPTTMFLAGDDQAAKQTVEELLRSVGWAADQLLDLGGIDAARQLEANIMFWLKIMNAVGSPTFNIRIVRA